jgi:hypothetical protein
VEAVRQNILDRANIQTTHAPAMEIQMRDGNAHIISRSAIPGQVQADPRDQRRLGVKIAAMTVGDKTLSLADELLTDGWHDLEADGRWTNGSAITPAALVDGGIVTIELAIVTCYRAGAVEAA